MTKAFNLHKAIRARLLRFLDEATPEQLALIPEGFHNNILWNIAHCVVTQGYLPRWPYPKPRGNCYPPPATDLHSRPNH